MRMAAEDGILEGVGQGDGNVLYEDIAELSSEERKELYCLPAVCNVLSSERSHYLY